MTESRHPSRFEQNPKKLRTLILYLCELSKDDPRWCMTKLCLLLSQIDFGAFLELSKPITGSNYIKVPFGMYPVGLNEIINDMVAAREIKMVSVRRWKTKVFVRRIIRRLKNGFH